MFEIFLNFKTFTLNFCNYSSAKEFFYLEIQVIYTPQQERNQEKGGGSERLPSTQFQKYLAVFPLQIHTSS